jgi:3-phenylpropionate/trans-cinnamate dioxygenase ferredoxin reductase subunit
MLGEAATYERLPYFFSDQYELGMEYTGHVDPEVGDVRVVVRGDIPAREFIAFWVSDGRVLAAMNVNVWEAGDPIRELIRSGERVDTLRLGDPDIPLEHASAGL